MEDGLDAFSRFIPPASRHLKPSPLTWALPLGRWGIFPVQDPRNSRGTRSLNFLGSSRGGGTTELIGGQDELRNLPEALDLELQVPILVNSNFDFCV